MSSLKSEYKVFYLDDGTIGGTLEDISEDLKYIEEEGQNLGLHLNVAKSELIYNNYCSEVEDVYTVCVSWATVC